MEETWLSVPLPCCLNVMKLEFASLWIAQLSSWPFINYESLSFPSTSSHTVFREEIKCEVPSCYLFIRSMGMWPVPSILSSRTQCAYISSLACGAWTTTCVVPLLTGSWGHRQSLEVCGTPLSHSALEEGHAKVWVVPFHDFSLFVF